MIRSLVAPISKVINRISLVSLLLMMLLTVADVIMRKLFNNSILGTVEVTEMMMIVLIFFALARTEDLNGNVKVDLVISRLSSRAQAGFDIFTQLVCWLLFVIATIACLVYAENMRLSGEVSQDLHIPIWPFVYFIAFGTAMLSLMLLIRFLDVIGEVTNND